MGTYNTYRGSTFCYFCPAGESSNLGATSCSSSSTGTLSIVGIAAGVGGGALFLIIVAIAAVVYWKKRIQAPDVTNISSENKPLLRDETRI
jgi:hypothetical protein